MAIRFDKQLNREIARTVRNFNKKVYRLEKMQHELVPARESVAALKSEYTSRADLKRRLKQLQGFSTRGVEDIITTKGGARISQWELSVTKEQARIAKLRLSRQISKMESITPTVYGVKQMRNFSEMGSEELSNLRARRESLNKRIDRLSQEQLGRYQGVVERQFTYMARETARLSTFYQSMFDILDKAAYGASIPQEQVDNIKNALMKLNFTQFKDLYNTETAFKAIIDDYVKLKIQAGVLTTQDMADLREKFTELSNVIDDLVEKYA